MNFGTTNYNGETYQLLNMAEYDNTQYPNGEEYYVAKAEKDGKMYYVHFLITDHETEDAAANCDYDNASFVVEVK